MSSTVAQRTASPSTRGAMSSAYPVMGVVFAGFLVIGMALPVLPLHVHQVLGFGPFVVGLVAGFQFIAALLSRLWAGRLSDSRGPRSAVTTGLSLAVASGVFYLVSLQFLRQPVLSVALLLVGRTLMGGAESLIITGGIAWTLGLVDSRQSAKAIAWTGMAMFAALAVGAPLGSIIYTATTFTGISAATVLLSGVALVAARKAQPFLPAPAKQQPFCKVMKAVLLPGLGFALSGITFGVITAFLTLFFAMEGWSGGAFAFAAFAISLIIARVIGGHWPDRFGGARVALLSLLVQAAGLAMIGFSPEGVLATIGSVVAGAGFSLVFPSLGLEAVRLAPPEARGLAMGVYNAYLDLTLGFVAPALGVLAGVAGIRSVFFAGSIAALAAIPLAARLSRSGLKGAIAVP